MQNVIMTPSGAIDTFAVIAPKQPGGALKPDTRQLLDGHNCNTDIRGDLAFLKYMQFERKKSNYS